MHDLSLECWDTRERIEQQSQVLHDKLVAPILSDAYGIIMIMLYGSFAMIMVAVFMMKGTVRNLGQRSADSQLRCQSKPRSDEHRIVRYDFLVAA